MLREALCPGGSVSGSRVVPQSGPGSGVDHRTQESVSSLGSGPGSGNGASRVVAPRKR